MLVIHHDRSTVAQTLPKKGIRPQSTAAEAEEMCHRRNAVEDCFRPEFGIVGIRRRHSDHAPRIAIESKKAIGLLIAHSDDALSASQKAEESPCPRVGRHPKR
jgi:hypothetical protein